MKTTLVGSFLLQKRRIHFFFLVTVLLVTWIGALIFTINRLDKVHRECLDDFASINTLTLLRSYATKSAGVFESFFYNSPPHQKGVNEVKIEVILAKNLKNEMAKEGWLNQAIMTITRDKKQIFMSRYDKNGRESFKAIGAINQSSTLFNHNDQDQKISKFITISLPLSIYEASMERHINNDYFVVGLLFGFILLLITLFCFIWFYQEREYQKATDQLTKTKDNLANGKKKFDQFLLSILHEIKNPLNAILGYSDLLIHKMNKNLDPMQSECVKRIKHSGTKLLFLSKDLGYFTLLERDKIKLIKKPVDLNNLISATIAMHELAINKKELKINYKHYSFGIILADENRLSQVLSNILANAIKFTPKTGKIEVTTWRQDREQIVCVEDSGIGISPQNQKMIFNEFWSLNAKTHNGTNFDLGLGLAISKKLIQGHGGRIWLDSQTGKGCRFFFSIPCSD